MPSDNEFNPARLEMLKHFNWSRVGILCQDSTARAEWEQKGTDRYVEVGINKSLSIAFFKFLGKTNS